MNKKKMKTIDTENKHRKIKEHHRILSLGDPLYRYRFLFVTEAIGSTIKHFLELSRISPWNTKIS